MYTIPVRIGIGITTRKRPEVLTTALAHFTEFPTENSKIVIVEDDPEQDHATGLVVANFQEENPTVEVIFRKSTQRLGIARAKNACLAMLQDCDHVFLFDDDTWPKAHGWAEKWIEINQANNVGHSMWNVFVRKSENTPSQVRASIEPIQEWVITTINDAEHQMVAWQNCLGVVLYFSRACLDAIGGYDGSAENVYGYEHAQVSHRASDAGFCLGYPYISPAIGDKLVYSFDISYRWMGEESPLDVPWKHNFRSSVTDSEAAGHPKNAVLMSKRPVHIPLVDPLA